MWFDNVLEDWVCLHCKKEFLKGRRGGMFEHVNTIDIKEIRSIIVKCQVVKDEIVSVLHPYTLRNLLIDLSKKDVCLE